MFETDNQAHQYLVLRSSKYWEQVSSGLCFCHGLVFLVLQQAHSALGSKLEEEKATTAQLNNQILDSQVATAKLQRTIGDLEEQVVHSVYAVNAYSSICVCCFAQC